MLGSEGRDVRAGGLRRLHAPALDGREDLGPSSREPECTRRASSVENDDGYDLDILSLTWLC